MLRVSTDVLRSKSTAEASMRARELEMNDQKQWLSRLRVLEKQNKTWLIDEN